MMTPAQHKRRHVRLHKALDELAADFLSHTGKLLSKTTVMALLEWSHQQTINPIPLKGNKP